ncbi:MAG: YbaB/EbfC family nucleoid-associated protein [Lachnospiraceae bacterium]
MAKRGGFSGGMPGGMNNLMKQAQRMQRQMEEQQKEFEEKVFTATSGGGAVEISVNGKKEVQSLKIDPEAVDPEDVETLQDIIVAAINEVFSKVDEAQSEMMGKMTGGMGGLGGLGGLGSGLF